MFMTLRRKALAKAEALDDEGAADAPEERTEVAAEVADDAIVNAATEARTRAGVESSGARPARKSTEGSRKQEAMNLICAFFCVIRCVLQI